MAETEKPKPLVFHPDSFQLVVPPCEPDEFLEKFEAFVKAEFEAFVKATPAAADDPPQSEK